MTTANPKASPKTNPKSKTGSKRAPEISAAEAIRDLGAPAIRYPGGVYATTFPNNPSAVYLGKGLCTHLGLPEKVAIYISGDGVLMEPVTEQDHDVPASYQFRLGSRHNRQLNSSRLSAELKKLFPEGGQCEPTEIGVNPESGKPFVVWNKKKK